MNPSFESSTPSSTECPCDLTFSLANPSSKITLNISAFNNNTTNFGRCAAPKPKSLPMPLQPLSNPPLLNRDSTRIPGMIMPM
jgi:hypothetical protein